MGTNEVRSKARECGIMLSLQAVIRTMPLLNEKPILLIDNSVIKKIERVSEKAQKPLLSLTDKTVSKKILATIFLKEDTLPFCTNKDGAVEMNIYLDWLAKVGGEALEKLGAA
jgi:hypothetical protein